MTTVPAFTPLPGGFVTAQPLPDGRIVVESWWLNPTPFTSAEPCTEPVGHWITADADEAIATIAEFTADLTRLAATPTSTTAA